MKHPEEIISDEEVAKVHGYANFGSMTPREVVDDGVRQYAVGFTGGATQVAILREHGLITKPKGRGYNADLTQKGKRYARAIWNARADLPSAKVTVKPLEWTKLADSWIATDPLFKVAAICADPEEYDAERAARIMAALESGQ